MKKLWFIIVGIGLIISLIVLAFSELYVDKSKGKVYHVVMPSSCNLTNGQMLEVTQSHDTVFIRSWQGVTVFGKTTYIVVKE